MENKFERKVGTGVLLQEGQKKSPNAPDYKGELRLDQDYKAGELLKVAGWHKASGNPGRFLITLKIDNWKPDPNYKADPNKPSSFDMRGPQFHSDDVPF